MNSEKREKSAVVGQHQLMIVVHGNFVELLAVAGQLSSICAEGQIKKAEIREIAQ